MKRKLEEDQEQPKPKKARPGGCDECGVEYAFQHKCPVQFMRAIPDDECVSIIEYHLGLPRCDICARFYKHAAPPRWDKHAMICSCCRSQPEKIAERTCNFEEAGARCTACQSTSVLYIGKRSKKNVLLKSSTINMWPGGSVALLKEHIERNPELYCFPCYHAQRANDKKLVTVNCTTCDIVICDRYQRHWLDHPYCELCFSSQFGETIAINVLDIDRILGSPGQCNICNYRIGMRNIEFDHLEPRTKQFTIGREIFEGRKHTDDEVVEEATKCRAVCRLCHGGITTFQVLAGIHGLSDAQYQFIEARNGEKLLAAKQSVSRLVSHWKRIVTETVR